VTLAGLLRSATLLSHFCGTIDARLKYMEIEEEYKVPSLIKSYGLRIILPQIYRGKMIPNPNRLKILRQIHECQEELKRIS